MPLEVELESQSSRDSNKSANHHEDESKQVARFVRVDEEVRRNDIADLSEHVAKGDGDGTVLWRAAHGARNPGADEWVGGVHASDVDERGSVAGAAVCSGQTDDVADATDGNWAGEMVAALDGLVRVPCVDKRADGGEDVRRAGEQQTDDVAVAESTHDRGEEVGEAVGRGDADVERNEQHHFPVEDCHLETGPDTCLRHVGRDTVCGDASCGDLAHVLGHRPHGATALGVRVVGQQEESDDGEACTANRQDNEKPFPALKSVGLEYLVNVKVFMRGSV